LRSTSYCSGVSSSRHCASVFVAMPKDFIRAPA
jgi:hypothetical protein